MRGIIWELTAEFASFRPFYTTTIVDTYPFPPKTTIIGMIGAALGLTEDEIFEYYEKIKVGIKIEHYDSIFNDLQKIWKVEDDKVRRTPFVIIKRFLYKPRFMIYLLTPNDEILIDTIEKALNNPEYPITLGDSDSLFYPENIDYFKIVENVKPVKSRFFRCLIDVKIAKINGGIKYPKVKINNSKFKIYPKIVKVPISFEKTRKNPKIVEVLYHSQGEVELEKEIDAYEFKGEPIYLF